MRTYIYRYEHDEGDLVEVEVIYTYCNEEVRVLDTKINGFSEKLEKPIMEVVCTKSHSCFY
jgi:hypothetical protein